MEHQTEATPEGLRCTLCLRAFPKEVWGDCPGVPQFCWEPWPDGLETAKQLSTRGLVAGEKRGAIWYPKARDGSGWLWLYRTEEATPKPPKSEKQLAAVAKMQAAHRGRLRFGDSDRERPGFAGTGAADAGARHSGMSRAKTPGRREGSTDYADVTDY